MRDICFSSTVPIFLNCVKKREKKNIVQPMLILNGILLKFIQLTRGISTHYEWHRMPSNVNVIVFCVCIKKIDCYVMHSQAIEKIG